MKSIVLHCLIIIASSGSIILSMSSCNSAANRAQLNTVDSLQSIISQLEKTFNAIDLEHHKENRSKIMREVERIERHFISQGDTMPRDIALKLSEFRLVHKGYKRMESEYDAVGEELTYTSKQLNSLRHDFKNNSLREIHSERFLAEEKNAVEQLELKVNSFDAKMIQTEAKYIAQNPVIVSLADSLEQSQ